jgi:hypothetical protein
MEKHVKVLGAVYIALGALGLVAAVLLLLVFGGILGLAAASSNGGADAVFGLSLLAATSVAVCAAALLLSVPAMIVGWGLLTLRAWAWLAGVILSVLMVVNFPLGTLVAIYGLIVLLHEDSGRVLGRRIPRAGAGEVSV